MEVTNFAHFQRSGPERVDHRWRPLFWRQQATARRQWKVVNRRW